MFEYFHDDYLGVYFGNQIFCNVFSIFYALFEQNVKQSIVTMCSQYPKYYAQFCHSQEKAFAALKALPAWTIRLDQEDQANRGYPAEPVAPAGRGDPATST